MLDNHNAVHTGQSFSSFKNEMLKIIKQNRIYYQELQDLSNDIKHSLKLLSEIQNKIGNDELHDELNELIRYPGYDNLISPKMQDKIAAYYKKHKNKTYSTKYKIDKKIHEMLMNLGRYIEKVERKIKTYNIKKSEVEQRCYSVILDVNVKFRDYLAFLSKTLQKISVKLGVLGTGLFYSTTLLSTYLPDVLEWVKIIFLFNRLNDLLIITSFALDPNKKKRMEIIKLGIIDILGIHKNRLYGIYIKFVYKMYDILNAIMSFIANLENYLRSSNNWEDFYKKLEAHIAVMSGISRKRLLDVIDFDIVVIDELLKTLDKSEMADAYTYSLRVSYEALNRLRKYYGDKVSTESGWIRFTLRYAGGRYYIPSNPLDHDLFLDISGFAGDASEKANFVIATILLADEIILNSVNYKQLSRGIIRIDLQELRWLVYRSRSWLARRLDEILLRDTKLLTPQTLGYALFEAFIKTNVLKNVEVV